MQGKYNIIHIITNCFTPFNYNDPTTPPTPTLDCGVLKAVPVALNCLLKILFNGCHSANALRKTLACLSISEFHSLPFPKYVQFSGYFPPPSVSLPLFTQIIIDEILFTVIAKLYASIRQDGVVVTLYLFIFLSFVSFVSLYLFSALSYSFLLWVVHKSTVRQVIITRMRQ